MAEAEGGLNETHIYTDVSLSEGQLFHMQTYCSLVRFCLE